VTAEEAMSLYQKIDRTERYRQIETIHSSPENSFYYYEVGKRDGLGQEVVLCISGYLADLVCAGYLRPKTEWEGFLKERSAESSFSDTNGRYAEGLGPGMPVRHSCMATAVTWS